MRLVFLAVIACLVLRCDSCTTLVAGRLATTDGSTLAAHTDDGLTDPRIMHIPARSHAPNSVRPVYPSPEVYPRYVGYDRGAFYHPLQGQNVSQPLGHIAQAEHTYAYLQGTYGIMNEFGLGIAESTCSGERARVIKGLGFHVRGPFVLIPSRSQLSSQVFS
jgi:dipeptidase